MKTNIITEVHTVGTARDKHLHVYSIHAKSSPSSRTKF